MATARWMDLCLDTGTEPGAEERLGAFWAAVAGEPLTLCPVPEPKAVKHRVHLDVYTASVDDLVALGATVLRPAAESGLGWTVMADPEGGEFCAFLRDPAALPTYRVHGLVVDSADPEASAHWWGTAFGVPVQGGPERGWWWLEDVPGMPMATMDFVPVPEPKTVKNRLHWDVYGSVPDLRELGATLLRPRDDEIGWDVLADPEGNEFCVFAEPDETEQGD